MYYIPDGKGGGILFDAGYAMPRSFNDFMAGFRLLAARLKQSGQIPADAPFTGLITTIIISHEHHDHASGVPRLRQYFPRARVLASRATAALLGSKRIARANPGDLLERLLMRLFMYLVRAQQSIHVDQLVGDGDVLACGSREFVVVLAPGHSPGQLLLHEPATGIMLASDLILRDGSTWLGPPHSDYVAYQESMNQIARMGVSLLLPAHGGSIRAPRERVLELLSFRKLREEQIIRTCAESPKTAGDIAWRIYSERGIGTYIIAKSMVELVLGHLVNNGQLKRVRKRGRNVFIAA
ncbi:MAG: MBL fold metallo-hydrolase [Candidatus Lokiarchaeota archaeon]|nr:MBL fold metallo-hydrolase [Candidatus Lokiarchaeota archaeon]